MLILEMENGFWMFFFNIYFIKNTFLQIA